MTLEFWPGPIEIWTDGSYYRSRQSAAWCWIAERNGLRLFDGVGGATGPGLGSFTAELNAVRCAIRALQPGDTATIYTDTNIVVGNGGIDSGEVADKRITIETIRRHSHSNHCEAHRRAQQHAKTIARTRQP